MVDPASVTFLAGAKAAAEAVKATEKTVALIRRLIKQLRGDPDMAAIRASQALDEVGKTFIVVDSAFNKFGNLASPSGLGANSEHLFTVAGGSLRVEVTKGRGHCQEIFVIYQQYLQPWFARVFKGAEMRRMEDAFIGPGGLSDADDDLFRVLIELTDRLSAEARPAVALVLAGDEQGARDAIRDTYLALAPVQLQMSAAMTDLYRLKNDFSELASARH